MPNDLSRERATDLIRTKLTWVHSKLNERPTGQHDVFRRPEFVDGESFYFLGRHYRLKLVDPTTNDKAVLAVRLSGDRLLLRRSQIPAAELRIAEYYTRAARPYLNKSVARWKSVLGVSPTGYVNVQDLGFRWGSCGSSNRLNFHWRVMQLPPKIIDYIVVHELAHLKVRDHSPQFWSEVARALPEYAAHRAWLRANGGHL